MPEPSRTISEFCELERISKGTFYNLDKLGKAPLTYNVGPIRRITPEAHAAWRREREAEAQRDREAAAVAAANATKTAEVA